MKIYNIGERRKHFRIECTTPICTKVTIAKIDNKPVNTGSSQVCVQDISPGGLKFLSNLLLPIKSNIIIKLNTIILDRSLDLDGVLVRRCTVNKGIYEYGIKFIIDDTTTDSLTKVLDELKLKLDKKLIIYNSNFCYRDKLECLRTKTIKGEHRSFFRYYCSNPICGDLFIIKINNKLIESNSDKVCIEDIGPGGLRFLSHIDLPIICDILYEIQLTILEQILFLRGYIVRKSEISKGIFQYGLKFDITDVQRQLIVNAIDEIKIRFDSGNKFKNICFCTKDKIDCLSSRSINNIK